MTIKRYQARDMRTAMRQVREQQGPDAVILSTRQVPEGVEICALADGAAVPAPETARVAARVAAASSVLPVPASTSAVDVTAMGTELRSLRELLETQLAALAWNDFTRHEPQRAQALTDLTRLGVPKDIAWSVLQQLPADIGSEQAQYQHYTLLAQNLRTCESPTDQGGVVALFGPPGAGKTSTLCKLAMRWAMANGPEGLALICSDDQRIGSAEQLAIFGRLMGVETFSVSGAEALAAKLDELSHKDLVLIDTAGVHARDGSAHAALAAICSAVPAMIGMLVLPASAQTAVVEETLSRLGRLAPACAVLTRIDEAAAFGGTLAALIRTQLPVALVSDGPRIPEDLRPARADELVAAAIEAGRAIEDQPDEDLLARRFGGLLNVAA